MLESNEPSSRKIFTTKTIKERPNLISEDNEVIPIDKNKRLLKEEKIREYQKNQKRLVAHHSSGLDLNDMYNNIDIIKDTFDIDEDFLNKDGCTAVTLGLEPMPQRCYVCSICDIKKEHYMCN